MVGTCRENGADRLPPQVLYGSLDGRGKIGRPVGRWKDMIEGDIRKRDVMGWYDLAQDRKLWRNVVYGERIDAGVKRRRKRMQLEITQREEESKHDGGPRREGLTCPKCGRGFKGRKGGGFQRHVIACDGESSSAGNHDRGEREDDGGGSRESSSNSSGSSSKLVCPKCSKEYLRAHSFNWNVDGCGSLRSREGRSRAFR